MTAPGRAARSVLWTLVAVLGATACSQGEAVHLSVSELTRRVTAQTPPESLPAGGVLVKATVIEIREAPGRLVQLGGPDAPELVWVSGFPQTPTRGELVWLRITSPPKPDELVGSVYPSSGPIPPPPDQPMSERDALGILVGASSAAALAVLGVAVLAARTRVRRCPGCGTAAAPGWVTCPACGHGYVRPPTPVVVEPLAPVEPDGGPGRSEPGPEPPSDGYLPGRATRIISGDEL